VRRLRTVVLGASGHFGARIASGLRSLDEIELVLAGRDRARLDGAAAALGARAIALDRDDPHLATRLAAIAPGLVISAAGPFQAQDYRVARACIAAGAHYVDIADDRDFVCGIRALHAEAAARGVCVVSGASSVPTLTGAVVETLAAGLVAVTGIDAGITTSARVPGRATVEAVLADCGRPVPQWRDGVPAPAFGSQDGWTRTIEGVGRRRFFPCDVPDLDLLRERFPGLQSLRFGAGSEQGLFHAGLRAIAAAVGAGIVTNARALAPMLIGAGRMVEGFGTGRSALYVEVAGIARGGAGVTRTWELVAAAEDGANIPGRAAVCLARKLAAGTMEARGAFAGAGLVSLPEYLRELEGLDIRVRTSEDGHSLDKTE
jgi:hypothetical protein